MQNNNECSKPKCVTIDTCLNCRATAELSEDVMSDLSAPDKSLGQLLEKDQDESENNTKDSD